MEMKQRLQWCVCGSTKFLATTRSLWQIWNKVFCIIRPACWGFCPAQFLQSLGPKENHTEVSISYKLIWPINSGFLLTLRTYINLLFLAMLATWLWYLFQQGRSHLLSLVSGQDCGGMGFLLPRILLFSLPHLYFLSDCPAYASCPATDQSEFI